MFSTTLALLLAAPVAQQKAVLIGRKPVLVQPAAPAPAPALSDEQVLKKAHLDTGGESLVEFFRRRVRREVSPEELAELTKQLADKTPAVHEPAASKLVGLGPLALPALRRAVNNADDEDSHARARKCLEAIEGNGGAAVVQSAARVLASRKPEGAAEALINYLPLAENDEVVQEIEAALQAVGVRDGKPDASLTRALSDAVPLRRSVAARVLCQVGGTAGRKAVYPLLKDAKPSVRMQAALSLADSHDAEAVPVLIELVADLPPDGRRRVEEYLTELAGDWAVKTPQGNDAMSGRLRRELWAAWWRTLDGKQVLEEFRSRTPGDEERTRALGLIAKLDDVSPDVRARAAEELVGMGPAVASLLRQAAQRDDRRLAAAAGQCLQALEGAAAKPLPDCAPRLLALRRPEGAVEALIAYLPFAENDTAAEQLAGLLASLGCPDGKPDAALVRALEDKVGARRAAAAVALCKAGADEELSAVRKLLRDPDAVVRLSAAAALARRGEKAAVPVLIALLGDLPAEKAWEAEELLSQLAGDKAPAERVGGDAASRAAAVDAWKTWWRKEEKNVAMARLSGAERDSGLLLAVEMQGGRVLELDRGGKVRWQMQGLQWPWDAVVCPNGNVFVIHMSGNQVSLRERSGKEIWQHHCNQAFCCQRLRNGHFFVVCRNGVVEFDANGKQVHSQDFNRGWVVGGHKFPDGQIGVFIQQGQYFRLDATGKQVKQYQVTFPGGVAMHAEVLPGDRVVTSLNVGRIAEYDGQGKQVWDAAVINPGFPHRLPNGHTLVSQNGMPHVYEFDQKGKLVSEKKDLEYRPWRIRKR